MIFIAILVAESLDTENGHAAPSPFHILRDREILSLKSLPPQRPSYETSAILQHIISRIHS